MNRHLYMMIGVPYAGKSHLVERIMRKFGVEDAFVYSTDRFLMELADVSGITYEQAFSEHFEMCANIADKALEDAIKDRLPIIWDQTNLISDSRKKKLRRIPSTYFKSAVIVETPDADKLKKRMKKRTSHTVPMEAMHSMIGQFHMNDFSLKAMRAEGFDEIVDL